VSTDAANKVIPFTGYRGWCRRTDTTRKEKTFILKLLKKYKSIRTMNNQYRYWKNKKYKKMNP